MYLFVPAALAWLLGTEVVQAPPRVAARMNDYTGRSRGASEAAAVLPRLLPKAQSRPCTRTHILCSHILARWWVGEMLCTRWAG